MIKVWKNDKQRCKEYDTIEWWMLHKQKRCHRHIKTYQEKRENKKAIEDKNFYGYKVRGKRVGSSLPDAWDDLQNSKIGCKGWKDLYRVKKQWMKPKKGIKKRRNKMVTVMLVIMSILCVSFLLCIYFLIRNELVLKFSRKITKEVHDYGVKQIEEGNFPDLSLYDEILPSYETMLYTPLPFKSFLNKELYKKMKEE